MTQDVPEVTGDAAVDQLFGFALPLGQGLPRTLDVGACPIVGAVEEHDARPDVDRLLVLGCEVVVEPGEQEVLDPRLAIGQGGIVARTGVVGAQGIGHGGRDEE